MIKYFKKNKQSGFSILFASLIGSLVLSIGLAILSITLKQITLATAGRESQKAFYAADTGLEYAMYLDRGGEHPTECPNGIFPAPGDQADGSEDAGDICKVKELEYKFAGMTLNWNDVSEEFGQTGGFTPVDGSADLGFITTEISVTSEKVPDSKICFDVRVTKTSTDGGQNVKTTIESRGYSTCNEASGNRFERAIKAEF